MRHAFYLNQWWSSFIDTYMFHSASMSLTGPGTRAHLPLKLQSAGQCYLVMNTLTSSVLWQGMDFMLPQASVFWLEYILEAYITKYFKVRLYNSMNISLHSYPKPNKVIDAKFCNGPNSCADVACAKFCSNLVNSYTITCYCHHLSCKL